MRSNATLLITLLLLSAAMPLATHAQHADQLAMGNTWMRASASLFEENKGQVSGDDAAKVRYTYTDGPLNIFLLDDGLAYQFNRTHYPEGYRRPNLHGDDADEAMRSLMDEVRVETYRMDMTLVGADPNAKVTATGRSQDHTHFYKHEALDVHRYSTITYHAVYPHIDWVIYCGADGRGVKYDFIVHPGGDPQQIAFTTRWVEELKLGEDGSLVLANRMGSITERTPVSFQGGREIGTSFRVEHERISFQVEAYDPHETLIIDPNVLWATYYGGNLADDAYSVATDGAGNVYMAGSSRSTANIAAGGHQNSLAGDIDAMLVKFNSDGVRQWATYYGGSAADFGTVCATDGLGNVYLSGQTFSSNGIASGGHQAAFGGTADAFLVKFNSAGMRQWGTYYGGSGLEAGLSCAVDGLNNVYLAGRTGSSDQIAFEGHQNVFGGGDDAFLAKFNSNGVRQWATYYGGASTDVATSCTTDVNNSVYIAGRSNSPANIAFNGYQNANAGGFDAFLAKFSDSGTRLWATYYGGAGFENGAAVAVDGTGNVFVAGITTSEDGIATPGSHQSAFGGVADGMLVNFDGNGARLWGTYYGGANEDYCTACAVDGSGAVYIGGHTESPSDIAASGHQDQLAGQFDAMLVRFNGAGVRQWATYYGGALYEGENASCATDPQGNVYLSGFTNSTSGIASGGHQNNYGGGLSDAFLVKFEGGSAPACIPTIAITSDPSTTICQGQEVVYTASVTDEGTDPVYQWKRNGTNVGTNAATYVSTSDSDGDVISCELSSNAPCADPAVVLSNALTMNVVTVDDGVALAGATLTAAQSGAAYQWLDCNSGFAPIAGQTAQSFSPTENGNYAVEITLGDCSVQSACVEVLTTGVAELQQGALRVYPNPAAHQLALEGGGPLGEVLVLDMQGRLVHTERMAQERIILNVAPWAPGAYVLRVGGSALRVVKE